MFHVRYAMFAVWALALAACGSSESAGPATKPKIEVYQMRGRIEKMPTAAAPRTVMIRHEATAEMGAMTMGFMVDEGVVLTGLAVGDKVAFGYEVDRGRRLEHVTKLEKLPAETVLDLGPGMTMPGE